MKKIMNYISLLILLLGLMSCSVVRENNKENIALPSEKRINPQEKYETYKGWWVYGEGQHIFKDETTLAEWEMQFLNEEMKELEELYLAVCEMEYFPMECKMKGTIKEGVLYVVDFEILYIQGCGEQ